MIYSWQKASWQQLLKQDINRSHAWFFYGPRHIGKLALVREYAKALLCEHRLVITHTACGQCQACLLFSSHHHPDFYWISGQEGNSDTGNQQPSAIKIDTIREVVEKIQLSSQLGGLKVILLEPAEAMTVQASNALLKILEEPPYNTVFLLLSHMKEQVLPTIISRCRRFILFPPGEQEVYNYLQSISTNAQENGINQLAFNSGAPFFDKAFPHELYAIFLHCVQQPRLLNCLDFAQQYAAAAQPLSYFLDWIYKWLADMILSAEGYGVKFNLSVQKKIQGLASTYVLDRVWTLLEQINNLARYKNSSVNTRLQVEAVMLDYLLLSLEKD